MTIEEKIAEIYETIADKTLSFGCKIILNHLKCVKGKNDFIITGKSYEKISGKYDAIVGGNHMVSLIEDIFEYERCWSNAEVGEMYYQIHKTIGHLIMIGDVLDWIENNEDFLMKKGDNIGCFNIVIDIREQKRKPINKQSDETINFIHNLIKKGTN